VQRCKGFTSYLPTPGKDTGLTVWSKWAIWNGKAKEQLNSKMLSAEFPNTAITSMQVGQWMWHFGRKRKKGKKRMHML